MPLRMVSVQVPNLSSDEVNAHLAKAALNVTGNGAKKLKLNEYDFLLYNFESMELTLHAHVAIFNNSAKVQGASVGAPPATGGPFKYSLLSRRWVPVDSFATSRDELLSKYGSVVGEWPHWG